jgi:hypothetical protein
VKTLAVLLLPFAAAVLVTTPAESQESPPLGLSGKSTRSKVATGRRHYPACSGQHAGYTLTRLRDRFVSPNWHPGDYPPQPEIVAHGSKPDLFACGFVIGRTAILTNVGSGPLTRAKRLRSCMRDPRHLANRATKKMLICVKVLELKGSNL